MKNNSLFKSLFLLAIMLFANIVTNAQSTASDVVVVDLINNGDMEGNDVSSFWVKVGAGDINPAVITDGVGVNGSRGIKVAATEKIAESWDNQFWIRLNQPVSEGTKIRVSFDYRADQEAVVDNESHAGLGDYISMLPLGGAITFTTDWNHFSYETILSLDASSDQKPMRSVAFTFNGNFEETNNYYFDNFQFEVVMEEQCPKPTFMKSDNTVSIQSPFEATIYYTTNGSTPTTASAVYTAPLAFTQDATIKAIAVVDGYETSPVATYEFENVPVVTNSEPYAVLSDNNTVVTFYWDNQKTARGGIDINNSSVTESPYATATTAVIDASFVDYKPTSTAYWFQKCSSLTSITGMENLNTQNVTDMGFMFWGCSNLTSLDVSHFNTEKVTDMGNMFFNCSGLTSLDVSHFDTQNVWNMNQMFAGCSGLTSLDVSHFNTQNVTSMSAMFYGCSSLTSLDVTGFNTQNVTSMSAMFYGCSSLTSLDVTGFNTQNVTSMDYMFFGCSGLTSLDLSNFNTQNVTNMSWFFFNCSGLTSLDVSYFKTDNVTNMYCMFNGCSGLTSLDLSNFNTQNVTNMSWIFGNCSGLTSLDVSNFKTDNVTDMYCMFKGCSGLTSLNVTNFNTHNVTNMASMFGGCTSLTNIDVTGFNTQSVTDMGGMFGHCYSLTNIDVSNFNTDKVTSMYGMFLVCSSLTSLNLSGFTTENVTNMNQLFFNCSGLTTIYVNEDNWSTANVTEGSNLFGGCTNLVGGTGTKYDANHNDYTYAHIDGGTTNPGYFTAAGAEPWVEPSNLEPYAVLSENNTVLTFYYDNQKQARGGMDINNSTIDRNSNSPYSTATTAVIDASFADFRPTSTAYWFMSCPSLTTITGMENLKTDNVTDMSGMFYGCSGLTSLDVTGFNTQNVTNMYDMFLGCSGLTSLDVSHFDTQNVTSMSGMFYGCSSLTSLDLSSFNTENVTTMSMMFQDCYALEELNISSFNTSKVTSFFQMFLDCRRLRTLDVSSFNTENVSGMRWMFGGCYSLQSIDLGHFNTQNVVNMGEMFYSCSSLTTIDLSNFNTQDLINMWGMFRYCSKLVNVNISNFNTSNVTNCNMLFDGCSSLASIIAGSAAIPDSIYAQIQNPNLLVYVNKASLAPEGVQNVVINGQAKDIILVDAAEGNNNWFCPQEFRAEKISYTREFKQRTQIGVSRGWESIALPFTVETITHEQRGQIAPFGNDASDLHFWLRHLGRNGLAGSQRIEANTPYVISMPNSDEYPERYNLSGRVTFSAENVMVPVTDPVMDETNDLAMAPTFMRMANEEVYALNVGEERNGHPEGSIFERNYREVRPFEAYTLHLGTGPAPQYFALGDLTDGTTSLDTIQSSKFKVQSEDEWYTLDGRKLDKQPTQKGVYINGNKKVVIK